MNILNPSNIKTFSLPGIKHQTIAGHADGFTTEVWKQVLVPGAATPPHFHECEEVICILQGTGEVVADGGKQSFTAESTLIFPPRLVHRLINTGATDLRLIAYLSESPARVFLPNGERLPLPWEKSKT